MNDDRACAVTHEQYKIEKRKQRIANIKHSIYMAAFSAWWRFLHLTRLARPYSVMMCKLNLYRKYADGRCHWCGLNHEALADETKEVKI